MHAKENLADQIASVEIAMVLQFAPVRPVSLEFRRIVTQFAPFQQNVLSIKLVLIKNV